MKLTHAMADDFFSKLSIHEKRNLMVFVMEMHAANEKHGPMPKDPIHMAAIVAEESGEVVKAALQYTYEKGQYYMMHKELAQTGAMCLKMLMALPDEEVFGHGERPGAFIQVWHQSSW